LLQVATASRYCKSLLRDRWLALQPSQAMLERLEQIGSLSQPIPNSPGNLSDRDVRRKMITEARQRRSVKTN
jgi:hypothetical protein